MEEFDVSTSEIDEFEDNPLSIFILLFQFFFGEMLKIEENNPAISVHVHLMWHLPEFSTVSA